MKLITLVCCLVMTSQAEKTAPQYSLIWEDNFDFFNLGKWEVEVDAWGGGNDEFQVYVPDNVYVEDGFLKIEPTLLKDNINPQTGQPFGEDFVKSGEMDLAKIYGWCTSNNNGCVRNNGSIPPIASGRVRTAGRFSFKYGKVEVKAKMPGGDWHWPAIWGLPEYWVYGGWPTSGEFDIVEIRGNRDLKGTNGWSCGNDMMASTIFWGPDIWNIKSRSNHTYDVNNNYTHFHIYTLEWDEKELSMFVDGERVLNVSSPLDGKPPQGGKFAPFDQNFHLLLNVAVGGKGPFGDDLINHGGRFPKPWNNGMSRRDAMHSFYNNKNDWLWTWEDGNGAMEVDYVRVYERT